MAVRWADGESNLPIVQLQDEGRGRSMREDVDPRELTPHPKNKDIYGNLYISELFVEDIEANGL